MYLQNENDVLVARFTSYLVQVAKHAGYDYFRQKRRYHCDYFSQCAALSAVQEFDQVYNEFRDPQTDFEFDDPKIQYAYQKLNEQRKLVLRYSFLYGFSEEEIADTLGLKKDYVRVVRFRALQSMRRILGLEGHDE